MDEIEYDVVIVGTGIAGAIIAKTLVQAGRNVLMLEAGLHEGIETDPEGARQVYNSYLQRFYNSYPKAPNVPYPNLGQAPSIDVLDLNGFKNGQNLASGYLVQKGPNPFTSDAVRAAGGTTLHWLGSTIRMLPNDFKMKTRYQQAKNVGDIKNGNKNECDKYSTWKNFAAWDEHPKWVNWPFDYKALMRYYEMAENEIGVSGEVREQLVLPGVDKNYFGKDYNLPMHKIPTSYLDSLVVPAFQKAIVRKHGKKIEIKCASTPQGRNSIPNSGYKYKRGVKWNDIELKLELAEAQNASEKYDAVGAVWNDDIGKRCEGNASCVPICPVQAKYDALKTIKDAKDARNPGQLKIITQAVASKVLIDDNGRVAGIVYKKYKKADSYRFEECIAKGKIYVLACGAIENARILLASSDKGVANSSDQVGRNLMDHLCLLTWGLYPRPVYPFRGPGSTTNICSFRDGDFRKNHTAWICPLDNWGWGWPVFSPGSDVEEFVIKHDLHGVELRKKMLNRVSKQVLLHFECEQDPNECNRVTVDLNYTDASGNPKPVINYHVSKYVLRAFKEAKEISDRLFAACGIKDHTEYKPEDPGFVEYEEVGVKHQFTYRGAGHIVGTHRMGEKKSDSVVDQNMRTWDHDNLYLAGCGNMPTLGTSNPTLTMAALTFKATEAILKQLEKM